MIFNKKKKSKKEWEILLSCEGAYDWLVLGVWLNERDQRKVPFGALQLMCGEWYLFGNCPEEFNPSEYLCEDIIKIKISEDLQSYENLIDKLMFPWKPGEH